jgi:Asp-tRNA(Asn)/Glu-tRNA(Gln) amidotransferase A subunit family amidase
MFRRLRSVALCSLALSTAFGSSAIFAAGFHIEEATVASTQKAIQDGTITCQGVVQAYINRIKAYNGTCTALVTADGKPIKPGAGRILGGVPVKYPTQTVKASTFIPDLEQYKGLPIEYGRMEPTVSDPKVQQQWGMRVGIPEAGGVDAIETLNIRGERSVTCKGAFDAPVSSGPLPKDAPAGCEEFRKQPDAMERAAQLDKQYGTKPDLVKYPLYCVAFVWKNWYDATDMRGTGGNDVNFAMDTPKHDSPDVARARAAGAISLAMTNAARAGGGDDGPEKAKGYFVGNNLAYAAWGGQPCNPYDTERIPRGSSSGSGVAVAANLGACSFCEQSGGSCMGPASRNGIVSVLTTKGVMMDGGYGYQGPGDRAGVYCRTLADAVKVLDVVKGFEHTDIYSALPKSIIPKEPYASFLLDDGSVASKPLMGMRIGIVREFMVKHSKNDAAISDQTDKEIKSVLRDKLGAEIVESVDPLYPDDPSVPNMKYTFEDAIKEIFPANVPEYFAQKTPDGKLEFAVPGWDVTSIDYLTALSLGKAPLSPKLSLRRTFKSATHTEGSFGWDLYLGRRDDERVKDWARWVSNAKFDSESFRAQAVNSVNNQDARAKAGSISYLKMQLVLRLVALKVMRENHIDAFVNPENTLPPFKIGRASQPVVNNRDSKGVAQTFTAMMGAPEIQIPAGFNEVVYEPSFVLSPDGTKYEEVAGDEPSKLRHPMPISLTVWGGPGDEPTLIKVASAYEAATHHRAPPPMFPPLKGEP